MSHSTISAPELAERIADPGHTVIDVRPVAAYNGWTLRGEPRGGHVRGARSVPLEWTRYLDWIDVLDMKGIDPARPVTVYGYSPEDAAGMAGKLDRLDFHDISVYDGFADEWSPDPDRPLERLPRYRQLVHAAWLHRLMRGEGGPAVSNGSPEALPADRVLCHAHFGNPDDYAAGHIPGAVSLDTNALESPETWNRRTPSELEEALTGLGIRHDTTVIVYGRHSNPTYDQEQPGQSAGHLAAMRCAMIMLYAGVEDVRVLNGGIHSWVEAGHGLSGEEKHPEPVREFGVEIPARSDYIIDTPEARELIEAEDGVLVSIRSRREVIGERSGYHYIERKGRIPGAVFGDCGTDAYHMENYRNFDHTTREFGEVARRWAASGIVPEKHAAFYCGTGWRGSEAFINAWLMGWPRISLYDGGWYEWSSDPANPIATGPLQASELSALR